MKKFKYLVIVMCLSVALLCIGLFGIACATKLPYNAILNSHANDLISDDFLKENRVKAYYPIDPKDEYTEYIHDKDSPDTRTSTITEQQEFDEIFTKCTTPVDFENQIVILYIFGNIYPREYYLKNIRLKDDVLEVSYELEWSNKQDAGMPSQWCFMLIMDKVNFTDVKFILMK